MTVEIVDDEMTVVAKNRARIENLFKSAELNKVFRYTFTNIQGDLRLRVFQLPRKEKITEKVLGIFKVEITVDHAYEVADVFFESAKGEGRLLGDPDENALMKTFLEEVSRNWYVNNGTKNITIHLTV